MTCLVCGAEFEPNPSRPGQRYCSFACKQRASSRAAAARKKAARHAARKPKACVVCGRDFIAGKPQAIYCSKRCRSLAWRIAHGQGAPLPPKICPWCGTEFVPQRKDSTFCSPECARHGYAESNGRAPSGETVDEARVRAYLALPDAERYARRGELTPAERNLAMKIWHDSHLRTTAVNDLL